MNKGMHILMADEMNAVIKRVNFFKVHMTYHIYSAIKMGFSFSRMPTNY